MTCVPCVFCCAQVLFADAWADSITQAFGHSAGVHAALALHYKEVEALEAQISVPLLHLLRTRLPLRAPGSGSSGDEADLVIDDDVPDGGCFDAHEAAGEDAEGSSGIT